MMHRRRRGLPRGAGASVAGLLLLSLAAFAAVPLIPAVLLVHAYLVARGRRPPGLAGYAAAVLAAGALAVALVLAAAAYGVFRLLAAGGPYTPGEITAALIGFAIPALMGAAALAARHNDPHNG